MHAVQLQDSPYASICVTCCPSDERFFHFVDVKVNVMLSMFKSPILYLMHAIRKGKSFVWRKRRSRDDSAAIVSTLRVEVQFEVQIACKIKNLAAKHCSFFITGAKLSANNITNIHICLSDYLMKLSLSIVHRQHTNWLQITFD